MIVGAVAAIVVYSLLGLVFAYGTFLTKAEADMRSKFRDSERLELKDDLKRLDANDKRIEDKLDAVLLMKKK